MKFVFLLLSFFLLGPVFATNYYFSNLSGQDSYTPAQAQNQATPWKSIDKLNTLTVLKAGDSVLFKKGETFYGSIKMTTAGQPGRTITYSSYGTGANPVISGFTTLTGWNLLSGNIFYASLDASNLNMVTINGAAKGMGRFPNAGYLNHESHTNNNSITDNQLTAATSWTGGEVVIRKLRWVLDRQKITAHTANTLSYSTNNFYGNNSIYVPQDGNGYFVQNHLSTLDQDGEWYYDAAAKRLYVYFANRQPNSYVVKASSKDNNVTIITNSYINFTNLDFEGANAIGISLISSQNIAIRNCNFSNQGGVAIYGGTLNAITVEGGSVTNALSNGIYFEYDANNCIVNNVSVTNTNTIAGSGRSGDFVGTGITIIGDNTTITNNRVLSSGYNGIFFMGNNVVVQHNYIDTFCLIKDDGAGIYTYTGSTSIVNSNRKISNNVILNAIGAFAGCEAYSYEAFGKAAGIYLDDYSNHTEISNNTLANGQWGGIFLHNTNDNVIANNLVYNYANQFYIYQDAMATRNVTVTGNQFVSKAASQTVSFYKTYLPDDPSLIGRFNNNFYARPIDDNSTILVDKDYSNGGGAVSMPLTRWQSNYALDINSQKSPLTITADPDNNIRFEYNATSVTKTIALNGNYLDIKNAPYSGNISLAPYSSVLLLKSQVVAVVSPAKDITPPTMVTKNITVQTDANGQAVIKPADLIQSLTDASGIDNASIVLSQTQFSCANVSAAAGNHQAYTAAATTGVQGFGGELGMVFKVNNPAGITINELGAFDHKGNGITGTQNGGIRVAIFNKATRTMVAGLDAIIVGMADGINGNHRMKMVSPVTLLPGEYVVVAKGYNSNELNGNAGMGSPIAFGDIANGAISYGANGLYGSEGTGFNYPANQDGIAGYLAGTFSYSLARTAPAVVNAVGHQAYTASVSKGVQNFGGELGMVFKVNNPAGISINELGAFDDMGNGITGTQNGGIRVAIYNKATRTIVAGLDATITGMADGMNGNHRMKKVTPVILMPGEYVVVAKGYSLSEMNGNAGMGSPIAFGDIDNGAISYGAYGLYGAAGTGFNYPANQDGIVGYLAGTFSFSTVTNTPSASNTNTVTITAKDIYGNMTQATATVTVICQSQTQRQAVETTATVSTPSLNVTKDTANNVKVSVLNVFPNPTTGRFTLQLTNLQVAQVSIEILSENGVIVTRKSVHVAGANTLKTDFDLTNQRPGIYFVKIVNANGVKIGKVMIQH